VVRVWGTWKFPIATLVSLLIVGCEEKEQKEVQEGEEKEMVAHAPPCQQMQ